MAYTSLDKYEMSLRQARVDIGQGRGNAMTNAIQWCLGKGMVSLEDVFEVSDKIFHYQQVTIERDFKAWLEENDKQLKIDVGLEAPEIQTGLDL